MYEVLNRENCLLKKIDISFIHSLSNFSAWQMKYPPKGSDWIDVEAQPLVRERGVAAWMFLENEHMDEEEDESNAAVMDKTTIVFCHGQGCVLTNLPLPTKEFVYWEVKVLQLHEQDRLAIGLATKPYPGWRLPGWHRHSVAYHSHTGAVHASDPLVGRPYGPPFKEGDVIGVGYLSSSGTVFFTRNGKVKNNLAAVHSLFCASFTRLATNHDTVKKESWQSIDWLPLSGLSSRRIQWSLSGICKLWTTRFLICCG